MTFYDVPAGHRTELSATTFANWVNKTANLLEELGGESGDTVWLPVLASHPGHWVGAVWTVASWQAGLTATLTDRATAAVGVAGPEGVPPDFAAASVACSLHPLGLGFDHAVNADIDYADVLTQPDTYLALDRNVDEDLARLAWDTPAVTVGQLADDPARDDRFVLVPEDPQAVVTDGVWACLLGTGSVVVVSGGTARDTARIAAAEHASHPST